MPAIVPAVQTETAGSSQPQAALASLAPKRRLFPAARAVFRTRSLALLVVLSLAFAARLLAARGTYLNADEVIQYLVASQPSLASVYRASLSNAHPPLHVLLLHVWLVFGTSELALRMLSVLAGTVFCWALFHWVRAAFGIAPAWTALLLAAFTPALIAVSAEVRSYALMLLFAASALYFLERAFHTRSARAIGLFSACICLAILSHYSAIFVALSAGIYALWRLLESRPERKLFLSWIAGQAAASALCIFQYATHISRLQAAGSDILQPYQGDLLHWGREDLLNQTRYKLWRMFLFLFQQSHVAQIVSWLFIAGILLLLIRELQHRRKARPSPPLGFLLLIPFLALWGAALAGAYPFVESRHTIFLAPFIIAGASCAICALPPRRLAPALAASAALAIAANLWGTPLQPYISRSNQDRRLMLDAARFLAQSVRPGEPVLVDNQTRFLSAYYLCRPGQLTSIVSKPAVERSACAGIQLVSFNGLWKLTPREFFPRFSEIARLYGLRPGSRVWVFQAGWGLNLDVVLQTHVARFRCLSSRQFGENIAVIAFTTGPGLLPAVSNQDCPSVPSANSPPLK